MSFKVVQIVREKRQQYMTNNEVYIVIINN